MKIAVLILAPVLMCGSAMAQTLWPNRLDDCNRIQQYAASNPQYCQTSTDLQSQQKCKRISRFLTDCEVNFPNRNNNGYLNGNPQMQQPDSLTESTGICTTLRLARVPMAGC